MYTPVISSLSEILSLLAMLSLSAAAKQATSYFQRPGNMTHQGIALGLSIKTTCDELYNTCVTGKQHAWNIPTHQMGKQVSPRERSGMVDGWVGGGKWRM